MSFGVSPSDIVKLVEFSTRLYVAFKDANDNSETQVEALVKEFSTFHQCLLQLDDLMKEYGKPLPFPYLDFKDTLERCNKTLKPYANHLVDNKKMTVKKTLYTIKYIGKEKEIDNLRKQITGHYQAIQMCISFLQLRLHLEATKQTQRLLDSAPFRSMSFGGQVYTSNTFATSSRTAPNALPPPSDADQLYKDWLVFNRWLKTEDDRIAVENSSTVRPISLGGTPVARPGGDVETAAVLYHLRRELEDAIMIEENRAKRMAIEKRNNLSPSDAIRQEVRTMPQIPQRTYTLDTDFSGFSNPGLGDSAATIRPGGSPSITSTATSPSGSPQLRQSEFGSIDWGYLSPEHHRTSSASTASSNFTESSLSASPESHPSPHSQANALGIYSAGVAPKDRALHSSYSSASLATIALGESALNWTKLCRKVQVERASSKGIESRECDVHWRYREDAGLSIRAVYRSGKEKEVKVWITQHFPATGPSIPLTTSIDGEVSVDFPRASFGRLDKRCTDIKYTFADAESSIKLQTLLYGNNNKDRVALLYDRPVVTVSSNKNKPECRGKNIRLWRRTEELDGVNGPITVDVLMLLFYTSALEEDKAHWVEEPHYVFQWRDDSVYDKSSDRLELTFSQEPGKWTRDKLFKRRQSSINANAGANEAVNTLALRRTSTSSPLSLQRTNTVLSDASSVFSHQSSSSVLGTTRRRDGRNLNRFGYSELDIKFQSKQDRKGFLKIWKQYVKPLGYVEGS